MVIIAFNKRIIKKPSRTNPRRFFIMIETNYQGSAPTAAGGGSSASSQQSTAGDIEGVTACISDIFSNNNTEDDFMEYLIVSEGVSKVKRDFVVFYEKRLLGGGGGGRKGPVVMFSRKSRRNLMIKLAEMKSPFEFWQDFTFADDIMEGLTVKERAKLTSKILKAFKLWLGREGYKIHGVWKREWRPRRTGKLIG